MFIIQFWRRVHQGYHRLKRFMPTSWQSFLLKAEPLSRYLMFQITGKALAPSEIIIDPINMCNLNCPLCPTGIRKLDFPKCKMDFKLFQDIVDQLNTHFPLLKTVHLFNWGETFLHPDVFAMIKYLKQRDYFVLADTNFSFQRDPGFFVEMVESGLDVLKISLDGASPESYSKYRLGGDYQLVAANLERLLNTKLQFKKRTPEVVWKYIVHQYNEYEVDKAREKAAGLGIRFEMALIGLGDAMPDMQFDESLETRKAKWLPRQEKYINPCYLPNFRGPLFQEIIPFCPFLFKTLTVTPDGKLVPCPLVTSESNAFGDLARHSLDRIWNNEYYTDSRKLFSRWKNRGNRIQTICENCHNFSGESRRTPNPGISIG